MPWPAFVPACKCPACKCPGLHLSRPANVPSRPANVPACNVPACICPACKCPGLHMSGLQMSWPAIDLTGKRLAGKRPPANVWPALGRRANGWPAYGGEHLSPRLYLLIPEQSRYYVQLILGEKVSKQCAIGPYFADCTKALYCDSDERHLATAPSIGTAKKLIK